MLTNKVCYKTQPVLKDHRLLIAMASALLVACATSNRAPASEIYHPQVPAARKAASTRMNVARAAGEGAGRGGSDYQSPTAGAAWFLGSTRAVRYCLEASPDFGFSAQELDQAVQKTFSQWREYVRVKKVNEHRDPKLALVMNLSPMAACDGSEDLKFYFGVASADVTSAKSAYANPIGFAYREDYDFSQGWAKGKAFIWIAPPKSVDTTLGFPDWSKPGLLSAVLLHEVGHVFGNADIPGTIMDPSLAENLLIAFTAQGGSVKLGDQPWMHRIDNSVELYACETCSYTGKISDNSALAAEAFKKFVGRDPKGEIRATFSLQHQNSITSGNLTIADDLGSTNLVVSNIADYSYFSIETNILSVAFISASASVPAGSEGRHLEAGAGHGVIQDKAGKSYLCEADLNLQTNIADSSPVQVSYFDHGQRKPLFQWVPQY